LLTAQPRPIHCFNLIKKRSAGCFASLPSCDDYEHMTATANRLAGFHGLGLLAYLPGLSMPWWVHIQTTCTLHGKCARAQLLGDYHGTAWGGRLGPPPLTPPATTSCNSIQGAQLANPRRDRTVLFNK
jgi:hypothetical protein